MPAVPCVLSTSGGAATLRVRRRCPRGTPGRAHGATGRPARGAAQKGAAISAPLGKASTGIPGLDDVLGGGLARERLYLVLGEPGVGKTTLALQFLLDGIRRGEPCLYVTLAETESEIRAIAAAHGWDLGSLFIYEFHAAEAAIDAQSTQTVFPPAEVDLAEATVPLLAEVARLRPARLVIDSMSEMRLLAQDTRRYRRQLLALKRHFTEQGCTVMLLDDRPPDSAETVPQTLASGVICLEAAAPDYGVARRRLRVTKLRGAAYREGYHDYRLRTGGIAVYGRLVAAGQEPGAEATEPLPSGIEALDELLGGGIDRGTSTLVTGAAGTGKSTVVTQYAVAASLRGERAALFMFDETRQNALARARSTSLPLRELAEAGRVEMTEVDPAELSPGEFASLVREAVEQRGASTIVIDSLTGYLTSVPEERYLLLHLHELLVFLARRGVATFLTLVQHGLVGPAMQPGVDVSYLADNILLLRFFEVAGEIRKAVSVIKKRTGAHERTLREFRVGRAGIHVGAPLQAFHGVLTGVPTYHGSAEPLVREGADAERR